jgi:hypothetical protein
MTHKSANRLARTLLTTFGKADPFVFEMDTPENAAILAAELRLLGMLVDAHADSARISVSPPEAHKCVGH